ncbi:MAG: hypothetical protein ABL897_07935 [Hyphomicrobium sp.]
MRKAKRKTTYAAKKRFYARRIVRLCQAVTRKNVSDDLAIVIEEHIIAKLSGPMMRRLVTGDWGRPMREAMKLTIPFFA